MTKYEQLIIKSENLGAEVREIDFGTPKKCGRCLNNIIYINSRITEREKYEILAEELGHFKTTHGNILDQNELRNIKLENIARREGFKTIIEPNDLIESMRNGFNNLYDMADYLNIGIDTLIDIINDFKKRYGIGVPVGNYYLQLEPHFGIIQDFGGLFEYKY